jgi:hydrogenase maturation protease
MGDIVVVGVGNPFRGDDGAGWAVIDSLEEKVNGLVHLEKLRGGSAELLDIFSKYSKVFVVDASFSDASAGEWERIDAIRQQLPEENSQTSTHGLGLAQSVALAKNLDMLPTKLIVYAIAGDHFNISDKLSPAVEKVVEKVAEALLHEEEVYQCTNLI